MKKAILILFLIFTTIFSHSQNISSLSTQPTAPTHLAEVNGLKGGKVSRELILSADSVRISSSGNPLVYSVTSFRLTIVVRRNSPIEFINSTGGNITDEMKDAIKNLSAGSKIYFEYIKARELQSGTTRSLASMNFIIE